MRCDSPIRLQTLLARCGQCDPCRASRAREWQGRILLEAGDHETNVFITLTYNDDHLPRGGSLRPKDLQDWIKRTRKALKYSRLRIFACGEYGSKTERPHYHAILFGAPSCLRGRTDKFRRGVGGTICCPVCALFQKTWSRDGEEFGSIDLGMVEPRTAAYIGGYIIKGKTHRRDARLRGKEPEYSTKSNRPGLGAYALDDIADAILSSGQEFKDVPSYFEIEGQKYPFGRYLTNLLRKKVGMNEEQIAIAQAVRAKIMEEEMLGLSQMAEENSISLTAAYAEVHGQKILNWKSRRKIHKRKDTL